MISLNSHYVDTVYPIGLSFETFVSDYHINVQVQENLHYLLNLGIKDLKMLKVGQNHEIL